MGSEIMQAGESRMFSPENELETLLLEAATASRLTERLINALRSSTLFVLGETKLEGNDKDQSTNVRLYGVDTGENRVIPIFTAERRISEYIRSEQPYIALPGRELFRLVGQEAGVVVNPGSACGMELPSEDIQRIFDQPSES